MQFNVTILFPILAGCFVLLLFCFYITVLKPRRGTLEWVGLELAPPLRFQLRRFPIDGKDVPIFLAVTVLFGALSFCNLGNHSGCGEWYTFPEDGSSVTFLFNEEITPAKLTWFSGIGTGSYSVDCSADGESWEPLERAEGGDLMDQNYATLLKWHSVDTARETPVRYLRITGHGSGLQLGEIAFFDADGGRLTDFVCSAGSALFDAPESVPTDDSWRSSCIFDEIYHVRTALEHLQSVYPYEVSHPPLGKLIISLGILLWGNNPFGWRFMGTLFGVGMLPILYCFLKNLFGKRPVALLGTLLLAFDFMHFTQTRIATIDTYGVFFILLSYWFFWRYLTVDASLPFRKSVLPLFFSGLSFGLGAASKWTVLYAGAGLAVLWILDLLLRARDANPGSWFARLGKTIAVCIPFFVLIPACIYVLSYIPYGRACGMTVGGGMLWNKDFYRIIWENQKFMFSYHSSLVATHPYSSKWYEWVADLKPILYYVGYSEDGSSKAAISAFGNPAVWWAGILAMLAMVYHAFARKDGRALFILLGFAAQLLPWVFITRLTFIYHYFPSTIFLILALSHVLNTLWERGGKAAAVGYTSAAGALFAAFYPCLSGLTVPVAYVTGFLRWFPEHWFI